MVFISGGTAGTPVQLAYNLFNGEFYRRYCASGNWSNWYPIFCSDEIQSQIITTKNITATGIIRIESQINHTTTVKANCYIDTSGTIYKTNNPSSKRFNNNKLVGDEELDPYKILM